MVEEKEKEKLSESMTVRLPENLKRILLLLEKSIGISSSDLARMSMLYGLPQMFPTQYEDALRTIGETDRSINEKVAMQQMISNLMSDSKETE